MNQQPFEPATVDQPRGSAPADRYHQQRLRLTNIRRTLDAVRKQLPPLKRVAGGLHHGSVSAVAALAAYLPTHELGLLEGYWSAITAVSVVQTEFQATESTARDQFVGAAIGGIISVFAALVLGQRISSALHLTVYAAAIVISMLICWMLNLASASRIAGSTASIILLVPHAGSSAERVFGARLLEVGWGVWVAVGAVWIAARLPAWRQEKESG